VIQSERQIMSCLSACHCTAIAPAAAGSVYKNKQGHLR